MTMNKHFKGCMIFNLCIPVLFNTAGGEREKVKLTIGN